MGAQESMLEAMVLVMQAMLPLVLLETTLRISPPVHQWILWTRTCRAWGQPKKALKAVFCLDHLLCLMERCEEMAAYIRAVWQVMLKQPKSVRDSFAQFAKCPNDPNVFLPLNAKKQRTSDDVRNASRVLVMRAEPPCGRRIRRKRRVWPPNKPSANCWQRSKS